MILYHIKKARITRINTASVYIKHILFREIRVIRA